MRIGILTYHLSHNYGAFLQAYSLATRLQHEFPDETVEIIDFNMRVADEHYRRVIFEENSGRTIIYNVRRYFAFKDAKKWLPVGSHILHSDSTEEFCRFIQGEKYDIIIAGSDEIWRIPGFRGFPNPYWLPGDLHCIKLSYAAASQSDLTILTELQKSNLTGLLNDFRYIGVRDKVTLEQLQPYTTKLVHLNCDPTFIGGLKGNNEKGKKLLKNKFGVSCRKKIIGLMLDEPSEVKKIQANLGKEYDYVALYRKLPHTYTCPSLTPFEWIDVIAGLDFLVTSFFHGICFAMINGTPFIACEKNLRVQGYSKSKDFLESVGMNQRYLYCSDTNPGAFKRRIDSEAGKFIDFEPQIEPLRSTFNDFLITLNDIVKR